MKSIERYCNESATPFFIQGKKQRYPTGCNGKAIKRPVKVSGPIHVHFPPQFPLPDTNTTMRIMEEPNLTLKKIHTMVENHIGCNRYYILVVWSENREQAWMLPKTNAFVPDHITIHVLVYDGCYKGPQFIKSERELQRDPSNVTKIINLPFLKQMKRQQIKHLKYEGGLYTKKEKPSMQERYTVAIYDEDKWNREEYAKGDLIYDDSFGNRKYLWIVGQNNCMIECSGENGVPLLMARDRHRIVRSGTRSNPTYTVQNQVITYSNPAPYGFKYKKGKPYPANEKIENWWKVLGLTKQNQHDYFNSVLALSYPSVQEALEAGNTMGIGMGGLFVYRDASTLQVKDNRSLTTYSIQYVQDIVPDVNHLLSKVKDVLPALNEVTGYQEHELNEIEVTTSEIQDAIAAAEQLRDTMMCTIPELKGATLIPNQTYLRYKTKGNNTSRHTDYDNLVHDRKDNDIDETNASLVRTIWIPLHAMNSKSHSFLQVEKEKRTTYQPGEFVMFGLKVEHQADAASTPRYSMDFRIKLPAQSNEAMMQQKADELNVAVEDLYGKVIPESVDDCICRWDMKEWSSSSSISPLWGGLYTDPVSNKTYVTYARYLVPQTNVFSLKKQITFIDRDGFIRNGQEDSNQLPPLRMLTDLEKRVILSTSCSLSYKPAYTPAEAAHVVVASPPKDERKDTSNVPVVLKGGFTSTTTTSSGTAVDITPASADAIVNAFNLQVGDCVADFGSGAGRFLIAAAKQASKTYDVIGFEVDANVIQICIQNLREAKVDSLVNVFQVDLNVLPFTSRFNDLLCSITHVFVPNPGFDPTLQYNVLKTLQTKLPNLKQALICNHGTIMQNFVESLDADTPTVTVQFTGTKHTGYLVSAEQVQGYDLSQDANEICEKAISLEMDAVYKSQKTNIHPSIVQVAKQTCRNKSYLPVLESRQSIINYYEAWFAYRFQQFLPYIATLQKKYVVKTKHVTVLPVVFSGFFDPTDLSNPPLSVMTKTWSPVTKYTLIPFSDRVRDTIGVYMYYRDGTDVQHTLFYGHQDDNCCADDIDTDNEMINSIINNNTKGVQLGGGAIDQGTRDAFEAFFQSAHTTMSRSVLKRLKQMFGNLSEQLDGFTDFFTNEDVVDTLKLQDLFAFTIQKTYPDKADHYDMLEKIGFTTNGKYVDTIFNLTQPFTRNRNNTSLQTLINAFQEPKEYDDTIDNETRKRQTNDKKLEELYPNNSTLQANIKTFFQTQTTYGRGGQQVEKVIQSKSYIPIFVNRLQADGTINRKQVEMETTITVGNQVYHLVAAVVHQGNDNAGHYIAYRKHQNQWYRCSDTNVQRKTFDRIKKDMGGASLWLYRQASAPQLQSLAPIPLPNIGNTCWLNSMLQLMLAIPELYQDIESHEPADDTVDYDLPEQIDVRGPQIILEQDTLTVFGGNHDPITLTNFNVDWLREGFALRFLSALTGLGWMQDGFTYANGAWRHPNKIVPNELKVLEYTADELMHLHQVTINGMLFPQWLLEMWNKHSANKSKFCFTMKQLIGTRFTSLENVLLQVFCIEKVKNMYRVLFKPPSQLYVKFGKGTPVHCPPTYTIMEVEGQQPIGACAKRYFEARQSVQYTNTALKPFVGSRDTAWSIPSNTTIYAYSYEHYNGKACTSISPQTEDVYFVAVQGDAPVLDYTVVHTLYHTFSDQYKATKKIICVPAKLPTISIETDTKDGCFSKWDQMLRDSATDHAQWTRAWLMEACMHPDRKAFLKGYLDKCKKSQIEILFNRNKYNSTCDLGPLSPSIQQQLLSKKATLTSRTIDIRPWFESDPLRLFYVRQLLDPDERNKSWYLVDFSAEAFKTYGLKWDPWVNDSIPLSFKMYESKEIQDHAKQVLLTLVSLQQRATATGQDTSDIDTWLNRVKQDNSIDLCSDILNRMAQKAPSSLQGGGVLLQHPVRIVTSPMNVVTVVYNYITGEDIDDSIEDELRNYVKELLQNSEYGQYIS